MTLRAVTARDLHATRATHVVCTGTVDGRRVTHYVEVASGQQCTTGLDEMRETTDRLEAKTEAKRLGWIEPGDDLEPVEETEVRRL